MTKLLFYFIFSQSDISNDDLDDEVDEEDLSSSLALSYKSTNSYRTSLAAEEKALHGAIKKQRSLTPDKKYSDGDSMGSIRKQRSLTPDKRSLTPESRLSRTPVGTRSRSRNDMTSSQSSLLSSKHSSGSRNSTLDRHRNRYEDARNPSSRSSSTSSSYSGGGDIDNSIYRRGGNTRSSGNYRIRRSR